MKISEQWLREWVNPAISRDEMLAQLTMAGLEVEGVILVAAAIKQVVIGEILELRPHPEADRLQITRVNVGSGSALTIVTGATNIAVGQKVPVALDGAVLAGGKTITASQLRGVDSAGMLCSATELGMAESSDGIMLLPKDAPIGEDFLRWAQLDDCSIELKLTPNRGDCLSILGVAREVAVSNRLTVSMQRPAIHFNNQLPKQTMAIDAAEGCPHYIGLTFANLDNTVATPFWLSERLRRCGIKSISAVVDIMNYVMLETGQPLHAFDFDKLQGTVRIRHARQGEKIVLLDGQTIELAADMLVIADDQQAHAVAGIMGGLDSAVTNSTQRIFIESAYFNPLAIAGRARRYGLQTDAAYRFERGVDPHLQSHAIQRAAELLQSITGGQAGEIVELTTEFFPPTTQLSLRKSRIERLLGITIPDAEISRILTALGMQIRQEGQEWKVQVPSYRFDIKIEADLIEEIARIYGYDHIPPQHANVPLLFQSRPETELSLSRLRKLLVDRDYREVITYSFIDPKLQQLLAPEEQPISLANPISADLAVMRSSLWPGLLSTIIYNQNRQQSRMRFFEYGLRFRRYQQHILQEPVISGAITGNLYAEQWGTQARLVDFYDVKGDIEGLLSLTHQRRAFRFTDNGHPALHPGQSCTIHFQDEAIGYAGALHPAILQQLDLKNPVYLFELKLAGINTSKMPRYQTISKFPAIRRDLALVVKEAISVQQIYDKVITIGGQLLQSLDVFDVYQGKGIAPGCKSIAIGLILQHPARTLVEDEINQLIEKIITELKSAFNVVLRE